MRGCEECARLRYITVHGLRIDRERWLLVLVVAASMIVGTLLALYSRRYVRHPDPWYLVHQALYWLGFSLVLWWAGGPRHYHPIRFGESTLGEVRTVGRLLLRLAVGGALMGAWGILLDAILPIAY